jgi:hypothetical protein
VQSGFFSTCIVYNQCNTGDVVVYQSGGQCQTNWLAILGLILIAVGIFGSAFTITVGGKTISLSTLFTSGPAAAGLQLLLQQRKQDTLYVGGCNSVCGKNTGDTPFTYAPLCDGYPIAYKEGYYQCKTGTCGGYEQKEVNIDIKDQSGKIIKSDRTRTDDLGQFSYTFNAPGPPGTYIIVVSTDNPPAVVFNVTTS